MQILREINKSACAFRAPLRGVPRWCTSTLELEDLIPASTVSTGNWGCGAYGECSLSFNVVHSLVIVLAMASFVKMQIALSISNSVTCVSRRVLSLSNGTPAPLILRWNPWAFFVFVDISKNVVHDASTAQHNKLIRVPMNMQTASTSMGSDIGYWNWNFLLLFCSHRYKFSVWRVIGKSFAEDVVCALSFVFYTVAIVFPWSMASHFASPFCRVLQLVSCLCVIKQRVHTFQWLVADCICRRRCSSEKHVAVDRSVGSRNSYQLPHVRRSASCEIIRSESHSISSTIITSV